jgi:protease-4
VAETKPVVAVMGEVAASGGYVAAIAADHVVARGNSLTGSIGVILEYPDLTQVMDRLGIGLETVRSSELKAEPSPFRPTSPAARAREEALVAESYAWFRGLVSERRGLDGAALDAVADGGVFTGRLALENGLVDAIGGEPEALEWLESRDPALAGLAVLDWEVERERSLMSLIFGREAASGGILGEISRAAGAKLYSIGP